MKNRIIKFRAWDGEKMHYDDSELDAPYHIGVFGDFDRNELGSIFLQFAGFYAKDNKECYEGDIINFGGYNLAIVFQKGEFVGKFKEEIDDENIPGFIIRHEADKFEIVGNVFENLDLVSSTSLLKKND